MSSRDDHGDEEYKTVYATTLPDYHLRNPLKNPTVLSSSNNIPHRHRLDRTFIRSYAPKTTIGKPHALNGDINVLLPSMSTVYIEEAVSDLMMRIRMDNSLLPRECSVNEEELMGAVCMVDNRYWNGMRFWGRVLLIMNSVSSNRRPPPGTIMWNGVGKIKMNGKYVMYVCRTCVVVTNGESSELYDGDWIRMASDINTQRFLVLLSTRIGHCVNREHYPEELAIHKIFEWGDNVLKELGNEGFKLLKAYEAVVIGVLQTRGEGSLVSNDRFLKNTLKDLLEDDPRYYTHARRLVEIVDELSSFHHVSQVYGLHRVWGHPIVDSMKGMEKLRLIGKKNIVKDASLSKDAGRMFNMLYSREYSKKFGRYPKIMEGTSLLETKILENDQTATNRTSHLLSEWDRVRFLQTFDLPESFNLSMIIADKAISPTKSELINSIKQKSTVMDPDKRRGVKRWLEDTTLKPKEFLKEINDGDFPEDHKIIGLTPKERELNPTPRMFSLMSHKMRVYVVVTEQMLSDHILKMFPQITMTDSLLDLTKKMYATVKGQSSLMKRRNKTGNWASKIVCMSLDFEKWNGHMRKEMTSGVFSSIGRLFGLPELYNMTYDIFESSYYYLADGSYLPKIINNDLVVENPGSFTGHKGGMEGLRQKGWTIYTVCCLEVILSKYDCTYKIMGMGDNQVLQITVYTKKLDHQGFPSEEGMNDMKHLLFTLFDDLVRTFTDAGLPLKPLETWMSEDLYLYGKVPLWKGVPLSMDLKKLMRTFPMSNEDIMTMENALGTVSSNATAATQSSPCIWTAYVVSLIMSSLCIQDFNVYHPLLGHGLGNTAEKLGNEWVLAMSREDIHRYSIRTDGVRGRQIRLLMQIVPKSIGGYNGMNIYEMMMRGFPDNVSRDYCYLTHLIRSDETMDWIKDCLKCWLTPIYMPNQNFSTLLEDVTAINILSPRSPTSGIRQIVANYMSSGVNITNEEFKDLMSSKYKNMSDYLSECLCEGMELHIRLLHDIYEATIFGYVDGILSKVVKTSTIQKLAIGDSGGFVFKSIERDELNYFNYFRWRSVQLSSAYVDECPTERSKRVRREGWRKELRGVTTPFPASYMIKTACGADGSCTCEDGYMSIHYPDGQMPNNMWNFDIGGNPPYLGSTTKEKVIIGAGGRIYSGEPLVRRPINLLKTINWFVPQSSNTAAIIRSCVSAVTNLDPEPYQGVSEGTAGSEVHRYRDSSTTHGALTSSNFLFSTRYHISTDNFFRYSKGSENTDIHYQALFCYILELSNMSTSSSLRSGDPMRRFDHYKQQCYKCINPIPEDFVDVSSLKALDAVPSRKTNPYLFVKSEKIRVLERMSPLSDLSETVLTAEQYLAIPPKDKTRWLQDVICDRIVADLMGGSGSDTHVSVGLLDVKSYERTMYLKFSPKYMIKRLISHLWKVAKWSCRKGKTDVKAVSDLDILRTFTNILTSADEHGFMGIAMFYCWEETAKVINVYPEMVSPTSNPITISTACQAMKKNLLSLAFSREWSASKRVNVITDDEKYSGLVYKMILTDWVESNVRCNECLMMCEVMNQRNLEWEIKNCVCRKGHILKDRMRTYPWVKSSVTVERLRKDGEAEVRVDPRSILRLFPSNQTFSFDLLDNTSILSRLSVRGMQESPVGYSFIYEDNDIIKYSLFTMKSLPTSTWYKLSDILANFQSYIISANIFCIGDGLGTSSQVAVALGAKHVISSTILKPDDAIPQTYVHNISPMIMETKSNEVDNSTMILRSNNVLDERWMKDWVSATRECSVIISDIEVIDRALSVERHKIFEKILSLQSWDLAVVKDYLFEPSDLVNRIGTITGACLRWKLVTTKFRSSHYPEVWWVLFRVDKDKIKIDQDILSVDVRNCLSGWLDISDALHDRHNNDVFDNDVMTRISLLSPTNDSVKMMTYLIEWLTFPVVGCMIPRGGSFTTLFLYLKKSKRPSYVRMQRHDNRLKLYDSDYYKLRDRLFAMAVAMLADPNDRLNMLNSSRIWHLDWYEKSHQSWWCKLVRWEEEEDNRCNVIDYIPILSALMSQQRLLFKTVGEEIRFGPMRRKRDEVFFPISKNASST